VIGALTSAYAKNQRIKKHSSYNPSVTVFIPTYNEEKYIETKLENVLSQSYPIDEILIYDCSTDNTVNLIEKYQERYPQIKLIRQHDRIGPAKTFNQALLDAKGEIIIKTDADVTIQSRNAIQDLILNFSDPEVGGACGIYVKKHGIDKYYRSLMTRIQNAESNIDSTVIAHTGLLAFRKSAAIPVDPASMAEDTEEFILLRKRGFKTIIDSNVQAEEETADNFVVRRKQRDRRAQGIIKAMIRNKDIFFNTRFGKYGFIIFPIELFIIVLSPFVLLAVAAVSAYILYVSNPLLLAFLIIPPLILIPRRSNVLFAAFDTQLSGLIATLKFIMNKDDPLWQKVR
jgi:cellulose synthase/poly-beta-1,6-N-acetylglucosamine synthase-like glycosyltransferase